MGYYVTMDYISFSSEIEPEEMKRRYELFQAYLKDLDKSGKPLNVPFYEGNKSYFIDDDLDAIMSWYSIKLVERDSEEGLNEYEVVPDGDEYYFKYNYIDLILAMFISTVIAEGEKCFIEFTGEDGYRWGFCVERGKIYELEYVRAKSGLVPNEDMVRDFNEYCQKRKEEEVKEKVEE